MNSTRTDMKAALALAVLSAAGLLAVPAHAGLLGNGSFEALAIADGANCPGVPLGKSCVAGASAKQQPDGSEVASLLFKGVEKEQSAGASEESSELTVTFVRDAFGTAAASQGDFGAVGLACAADPAGCREKLFGTSVVGTPVDAGAGAAAGGASSAFNLGFMKSVGGVQVSPQFGLSFLQASTQVAARGGDTAGHSGASSPERWEVTYGASNQPAAAVASMEGSSGWSSSGSQFQGTSVAQVQSYLASGPSGLMGGSAQVSPRNGVAWPPGSTPRSVPEPSVLLLAGAALAGLWMQRRRQVGRP